MTKNNQEITLANTEVSGVPEKQKGKKVKVQNNTPDAFIAQAVSAGLPVETLEHLFALHFYKVIHRVKVVSHGILTTS